MINIFLFIYITVSTVGLVGMKFADKLLSLTFILSGLLYGIGAAFWLYILRNNNISIAFPIVTSGLIITTTIAGIFIFNESITISKFIGLSFIVAGIIILASNSN